MDTRRKRSSAAVLGLLVLPLCAACFSSAGQEAAHQSAAPTATPAGPTATGPTATQSATTPPATPTNTSPARRNKVTVALSGDVLIHNTVWWDAQREAASLGEKAQFDFRPIFAPIKPIISRADLAICHLETPLAPPGGPYTSYPRFSVPEAVVPALKSTGYDACTTGSNHSLDEGFAGLSHTLDVLDRFGLQHVGTSRSRAESRKPVIFDVNGVHIGWLDYTYGTNGIPVDPSKPWEVNLIDPHRIVKDAHRLKQDGADVVMVALHWGNEYQTAPSLYQLHVAHVLTKSPDIDLIYGSHAHVVQPIRKVHGTWVVFGLGNLIADQQDTAPGVNDGEIALVTFTREANGSVSVTKIVAVSTHIDTSPNFRVRPTGRVVRMTANSR